MTSHISAALVRAASSQEAALTTLIRASALTLFPDMTEETLISVLADIRLLVHAEVGNTARELDLSRALEHSPTITSGDGVVALLTGANEVDAYLSSVLSLLMCDHPEAELLVPHAYAIESEIDSLVARNHIQMRFEAGHVYYCFDATNSTPESINKSLGSSIAMYSVAWVFSGTGYDCKPILAIASVFDGDGWALAGSLDTIFPTLRPRIH